MNEVPKHVTLELEEADVQSDIIKVTDAMSRIRAEALHNEKLTDAQKDEYLHLTYRLASGIEGTADSKTVKKLEHCLNP